MRRHVPRPPLLSRDRAGRVKGRQKVGRLYALISDVRRDMLDQLTTRLVRENQVLVVEDLSVASLSRVRRGKGRRRKSRLNEAILDASWGELLRQLRYKCEGYGRERVVVDRFFPSTRRCSACHAVGERLDVSVRRWTCAGCGAVHDRECKTGQAQLTGLCVVGGGR
ncbi:IS605 OrfB family transposase [Streptomyces achromogenes]|uniref:RNA-guided endonuclease TnpB family protein n=1 Tax=Streptomyces achromogenes TaxID=67255 RepID=UPI002780258A|nr:RNA-guided endonuclease TnpB family protein [Streptomyces achromogenes]MDQ0831783.1 IS605 OrfB family transposase [Streptomyces achromogenes]